MGLFAQVPIAQSDSPARTFIPASLEVPVFTPVVPLPAKKIPAMRVNAAITAPPDRNFKTLTVLRGEASKLPDLPLLPVAKPESPYNLTAEDIARIADERRHSLLLGATVFDHRVSLAQWHDAVSGENYEVLCGFDLSLLEGIGGFIHEGESYSLMLIHSPAPRETPVPAIAPEAITILKGNAAGPAALATITMLRDLIASEKGRLIPHQAALQRYRQAAAAWEKAHPPSPRAETFWLKPHRGSRYLADPQPEASAK